ncbi:Na/Pi cotransporter family protein [Sediminitomix flava]|uniref:Phosphate:Na+ symporter n=1 Tax=Sediminitomix flava TaxID=379075 RepID=A0A315ZDF8_SEDFL|nr:Na/Pi cotransporter family protein [Sediminitomix flava]PWJ42754.1 phosphate:Na+ symporter [Sediminitomix flava]
MELNTILLAVMGESSTSFTGYLGGFLNLIGALGFFIFGMKMMSDGIQKVAGDRMRQILGAMTSNRFMGVMTGFLITAIVQSSSATTVMVVSFVNAGLLTLKQSIGVIMGANVGTTVTAWVISILGFKVKMSQMALPIIAIAFPMMFSNSKKLKDWADVLIGFAFLFLGLDALKNAVPTLSADQLSFLSDFTGHWYSPIIFVIIGTIVTVVVQSSSAAMALTLVLCNQGLIPFEIAAAMVLGENIGTTITANLAATVANFHAKRAARAHMIFNLFGVVWMLLVFQFFLKGIDWYMINYTDMGTPFAAVSDWMVDDNGEKISPVPMALSIFHTSFNILNVIIMIGFIPFIQKLVEQMIPAEEEEMDFHLEYINPHEILGAEASLIQAKKEIIRFGDIVSGVNDLVLQLLETDETESKTRKRLISKIRKIEDVTDQMEVELVSYLAKVSQNEAITKHSSNMIRSLLSIAHDFERIGDIYKSVTIIMERKYEEKIYLSDMQKQSMIKYLELEKNAFQIMKKNLQASDSNVDYEAANQAELAINKYRRQLRTEYLDQADKYSIPVSLAYNDLISVIERVGDHIHSVSESLDHSKEND